MNAKQSLNIDPFLLRHRRFWRCLEEHCVADCCGLAAFEFSEAKILNAASAFSTVNIVENIENTLAYIQERDCEYLISNEILNARTPKDELIIILEKVRNVLMGIPLTCT